MGHTVKKIFKKFKQQKKEKFFIYERKKFSRIDSGINKKKE